MYTLRQYQKESVEAGLKFFKDPKKKGGGILIEPSGSGKSLIIASIAKQLDGNVIVFQPTKEILEQNYQKMLDFGVTDIGIYSASMNRKDIDKITFATIGSVINKKELFDDFKYTIVDECHLVNAKGGMYRDFIKHTGNKVVGLTATPYRLHSFNDFDTQEQRVVAKFLTRTKPRLFNEILHITQIGDLYEQGYLCPVMHEINNKYKHSDLKLNSTGMDFTDESVKRANEDSDITSLIHNGIKDKGYKHTLVFNAFVEEAEALKRNLEYTGIVAETISAKTKKKERERILREFRSGEIEVVTNVGVLTTGFDFPELDHIILARPTQSVALYYQMVGRGMRIAPGKVELNVLDLCGNVKRFGYVPTFEIVEESPRMHRLRSDESYLTGYCFINNIDLESKKKYDVITFGKHKDKHIRDVPKDYMEWCVENLKSDQWVGAMKEEINRRG